MTGRWLAAAAVAALAVDGCATTPDPVLQRAEPVDVEAVSQRYASLPGGCGYPSHAPFPAYGASSGVTKPPSPPPKPITKFPPIYPDEARNAGVQGKVEVAVLVCEHGRVVQSRVVSSIPALDDAAVTCLKHWVFEPRVVDGTPVSTWALFPIKFTLQ